MCLRRYLNSIVFFILCPLFTGLQAQVLSISSYSNYGIGEKLIDNDILIRSMGGISTAYKSILGSGINFSNPASNYGISYTIFCLEGNSIWVTYSGDNAFNSRNTFYFSKISFGFPLTERWFMALSAQPYSGHINHLSEKSYPPISSNPSINNIEGSGNINALQTLVSYTINDRIQIGATAGYIHGIIERNYKQIPSDKTLQFLNFNSEIKQLEIKLGALYSTELDNGKKWIMGTTYSTGFKIGGDIPNQGKKYKEIKDNSSKLEEAPFHIPNSFSLGVAYEKDLNWLLSFQFDWNKMSELNSLRFPKGEFPQEWENSQRFSLGGYWIPKYNSHKDYFSGLIYRCGIFYKKTGLFLFNQSINDYGINFGISLPLKREDDVYKQVPSYFNIGVGLGQMGSVQKGLIREIYITLRVSFTFGSKCFEKTVYD